MFKYEYVAIPMKSSWGEIKLTEHRAIIDDYAQRGYRYAGCITTKQYNTGMVLEIELIFEKYEQTSM